MGVVQSVRFTAVCARIAFDRHTASGFADAAGWGAALQTDRAHTTRHVSCGSSDVLLNCLRRPLPLTLQGPFSLLWRSSLCRCMPGMQCTHHHSTKATGTLKMLQKFTCGNASQDSSHYCHTHHSHNDSSSSHLIISFLPIL